MFIIQATETKREMKIKRGTKEKNLRQHVLVCVGSQCPASLWENYRRGRERESVCVCVLMSVHWRVWVCAMMCICECWCAFVYMHRFVRVCVRECAWAWVSVCNKKNKLCRLNRLKSCCCFHSYFLATSEKFKTSSQFFSEKSSFSLKSFLNNNFIFYK